VERASIADLAKDLPKGARLLGLDLGTKRIGLAVSDGTLAVATPLETVARTKFAADAERLAALAARRAIGGLVYGLPLGLDGREGPRCQATRQFARDFARRLPLPYCFQDERFSTQTVERFLIDEADLSRAKRKAVIDRAAAAYILQGALDALRAARRGTGGD
jgi:putative holliday junction resolvase